MTDIDRSVSLFAIEQSIAELMQAREEVTDPEEVVAVERALQQYMGAEPAKVDGCLAWLRKAEVMRDGAKRAAEHWDTQVKRMKEMVLGAMRVSDKKRLDGNCGSFVRRGNGGLAPLKVQPDVLPNDYKDITVRLPLLAFRQLQEEIPVLGAVNVISTEPANGRIRDELKQPCVRCEGAGVWEVDGSDRTCELCGGSGMKSVPGAWLEPRGEHLEVK